MVAELALSTRERVKRLGTFLADLTRDRPADRIHAEISDRLRDPEADHRLAGVYPEAKDFVAVWTAIRTGASLPASSWEMVVLPTVVHFSTTQTIKGNLSAATGMWMGARSALEQPTQATPVIETSIVGVAPVPVADPARTDPGLELVLVPQDEAGLRQAPGRARPWWIALAAAMVLVFAGGAALLIMDSAERREQPPAQAEPPIVSTPIETVPSVAPSITPSAVSASPTATPTPAPGGVPGLTAPRDLVSTSHTATSITLAWQAPTQTGEGGIAFYEVFSNGEAVGKPGQTHDTLINLAQGTSYTLFVLAHDQAGNVSAQSNAITVRTDASLSVSNPVHFEKSFKISGQGWHCKQVNIYILEPVFSEKPDSEHLVAKPSPGSGGTFNVTITVGPGGRIDVLDGDDMHLLIGGDWRLRAQCATGTQTIRFQVVNQ